ncbi:MAG: hypothetical protein ACTSUB_09140 [Candidatus Thorarchaeota archaeon]
MEIKKISFLTIITIVLIMMTPILTTANVSRMNLIDSPFQPSGIDIRQLLPDPEIITPPDVYIRGTAGEFTSSHQGVTDSDNPSYVELTWAHTAGTSLDWYNGDNDNFPECEDFIYFAQEFDWELEELPNDAYLNFSMSFETTGDFATNEEGALMFKVYVWLIDSSGNWRRIFRSYPPYTDVYQNRISDLNWFDIHESWGGMIEDADGVQEDPTDVLTLAVGLAPTNNFYEFLETTPWTEYTGTVSAKIQSVNLYTFNELDFEPDEMLIPLVNDTWGRQVSDIFDDVPDEFENANDRCVALDTDEDSSVYVLVQSQTDYAYYSETGNSFQYQTLLKYDSQLNPIWVRNQRNSTTGLDMCVKDGFIYTVGYENMPDSYDLLLTKWSPDGTILWETLWDAGQDEIGGAVGVTDDGSIFVLGEYSNYRNPNPPYIFQELLLKFNSNGVLEWNVTTGSQVWGSWMAMEMAPTGIYTSDSFLVTFRDFQGNELWTTLAECFTVDSEGNLYSSLIFDTMTGTKIQFNKTDSNGNLQWNTNFTISHPGGWDERLECASLSVAPDGSLLAYFGNTWVSITHYIVKFSPGGEYQWHKAIGDFDLGYPGQNSGVIRVAPNGVTFLALTLLNYDVGIYSFNVGVLSFNILIELFLIVGTGLGILLVFAIIMKKRPQKDYYGLYKEQYDL